jgi:cyclic beta-1,2-glucan synthetase
MVITESARRAKELNIMLQQLAVKCNQLANIDFDFLYYRSQHLLTIGYNVDEQRKDNGFYDLLASEARLTTFVAIAQGKLPQDSWFALGRQLTNVGTMPILLSWSGSMFEYLMPLLVMPTYENTLLHQTYKSIIQKQIEYGKKRDIPWGISESGYSLTDAHLNYQYKAFGVPGTGFKRGLGEDLVIAPYATMMALMVNPEEAYNNLQTLKEAGFEGKYGLFEAVDYTSARLQRKQSHTVIRSFMSHHQGMGFLSIAYLLLNKPMQQRFSADLGVKSALLLLQERIPRISTFYSPSLHAGDTGINAGNEMPMRVIKTPHTPIPEVQLLSNGRYHVMVTNSGSGYTRWKNIAVTRWREDSTVDDRGTFCYIREVENENYWSASYQPSLQTGNNYEAVFSQGRAEFRRSDASLDTHTEIAVSPEDDIELRRIHISNRSRKKRIIEITSYAEVVLAPQMAEEMHPAFSNLFVETTVHKDKHSIICTRRPRTPEEQVYWMFHLMKVTDATVLEVSYETDRNKFIGRGHSVHKPAVMSNHNALSGSSGAVLDPVVAMRYRIVIEPNTSATIDVIMGIADTENHCNFLVDKYQDLQLTNRVLELAWTHSQVVLRQLNATEPDAQLYAKLAGSIIFANDSLRTGASVIIKNQRGQSGLWGYSISGDLPIVLLQIEDASNIELVKQMIQAHNYWRMKGLIVDLVIWNEDNGGYRQNLQNEILGLLTSGRVADVKDQPGGIFIRSSEQVSNEDRILFQSVARVIISDRFGTLEEQITRRNKIKPVVPYFSPTKFHASVFTSVAQPAGLQFFNGLGGFSADGKEYVITTTPQKTTALPWSNVIANPNFGSIVTESGQAYTWMDNAHEYRLTPWNNDAVNDMQGEAFYLRDEESGRFWSPAPFPCRGASAYNTRHGFGYSIFEHSEDGIDSSMTVYADIEQPVKFIVIKLHNKSQRQRRLSATGYIEWILGDLKAKTQMHIVTELDLQSGAILAHNKYNTEFTNKVAFFDADDMNRTITTDRTEFIGRNGTLDNPDGMYRARFSGRTGAALDPCAVIQVVFDLLESQEKEIVFRLGAGENVHDVLALIKKMEGRETALQALNKVQQYWQQTLGAVQVQTPDAAVNILVNGWLNYQTIASRIWGRSGFYQSGGAFGFRDQLQDVLSLTHTNPALVRNQILLCASRQFKEGDVQHWWHPPAGRGVRTTCSDDLLWLPFVTIKYIAVTGDQLILDEPVHFLEGRLLNAGEESYYDLPIRSEKEAALYQHCVLAIEHALRFGEHGLPLIGSGDWNDGMDKVGEHGKGESVWLAFFLYDILIKFTEVANLKNDKAFAEKCKITAATLQQSIKSNAWDGEWFRRAYFDDGTPLGSKENEECKIDSIAQSWSVLSGAADAERQLMAMNAAEKYLVRKEEGIIQLFDPAFDKSSLNPGYIKGYVPGVRENGGQYTHAAIWLIMAFAALGDTKRTWELIQLINPINHGKDEASIEKYKAEPYVIAADVYTVPLHTGRGGWTWYTGAAGWLYQLFIESFIGLKREGERLYFLPCLPEGWNHLKVQYRYMDTLYRIELVQSLQNEPAKIIMDNKTATDDFILLANDGIEHEVKIIYKKESDKKISISNNSNAFAG